MAKDENPELTVVNNEAANRYEARLGGGTAVANYTMDGDVITFTHTEVPEEFEGQGVAGTLIEFALEDAKQRGLRVVPRCRFVDGYIRRHPEYQPLVV